MADFKLKYPSDSTVTMTIGLASLATNSANTFTIGRQSNVVNNTTNLDLDHLLSGSFTVGTGPTAGRTIAVYVFAPRSMASGVATYPDVFTGGDANRTVTSANVLNGTLIRAWSTTVDNVTGRVYDMPMTSIANLFGGVMPPYWGAFVAHDTGVALGSGHDLFYWRVQTQSVG